MTFYCFCGISFRVLVCHLKWFFFSLIGGELGENLLTLDHVQRRGFYLANRCFLCLFEVETVDHLLLHCANAWVLWHLLVSLFGVSWVLSYLMKETLLGWHGSFVGKAHKKAW